MTPFEQAKEAMEAASKAFRQIEDLIRVGADPSVIVDCIKRWPATKLQDAIHAVEQQPIAYCLMAEDYEKLRKINSRIYDDKPLTGDPRRDLANHMNAVMHNIEMNPIKVLG